MLLASRLPKQLTYNTVVKLVSELVGRLATFFLMILAARQFGVDGFGLYNYGLALGFILAQLADMGLQTVISREVAVQGASARPLVRTAFQLKVSLSLLVVLILAVFLMLQPPASRPALLLLGLMQLSQTYLEFVAYIYRGQQALQQEAGLLAGARIFTAVIGIMILQQGGNVAHLAAGSLAIIWAVTLWGVVRLRQDGWLQSLRQPLFVPAGSPGMVRPYSYLLQQAVPLGLAVFLSIAYTRTAVLLLQYRLGETAVAQFSAAARLVEPTQILPASLMAAVFPAFSLALKQNPQRARVWGARASLLLGGCGVLLAAFFGWTAAWLVPWLYGEAYIASVPLLQLLGLTTIPAFINYSLTHYLIARRQQRYLGLYTGGMFLLHLAASWLLIGQIGVMGPVISMLISELFLLVACLVTLGIDR